MSGVCYEAITSNADHFEQLFFECHDVVRENNPLKVMQSDRYRVYACKS